MQTTLTPALALATLSTAQAVALAALPLRERERIALRDTLIRRLCDLLPPQISRAAVARKLHDELCHPGPGPHGDLLRTVVRLSRGGKVPAPNHLERLFTFMG